MQVVYVVSSKFRQSFYTMKDVNPLITYFYKDELLFIAKYQYVHPFTITITYTVINPNHTFFYLLSWSVATIMISKDICGTILLILCHYRHNAVTAVCHCTVQIVSTRDEKAENLQSLTRKRHPLPLPFHARTLTGFHWADWSITDPLD